MKWFTFLLVLGLFIQVPVSVVAASTTLSPGIQLHKSKEGSRSFNQLSIDLNNPYTSLSLGLPSRYGGTATTSALGTQHSTESRKVVGAVNASFYHMNNGHPMYLLAKNNEIINNGVIAENANHYVSQRIAFGLTKNNTPLIELFKETFSATTPHGNFTITGVNRTRESDNLILYTPQHHLKHTGTNEFGTEYVFETSQPISKTSFGTTLTGKLVDIRLYGDKKTKTIQPTQFILSANGKRSNDLIPLSFGDEVAVNLSINEPWRDAAFILRSGPQLVKNNQVYLTMNENSERARRIAARSAVAIKSKTNEVHFVTVDHGNGNTGMSLKQFAEYLVRQGYDSALNLDGGGSTTMAYRPYGTSTLWVANQPTYGSQRKVSAILEAVSTAPTQAVANKIDYQVPNANRTLLVGASLQPKVNYAIDKYMNPLPVAQVSFNPQQSKMTSKNNSLLATSAGQETVAVQYNGQTVTTFTVNIVSGPEIIELKAAKKEAQPGKRISLSHAIKDSKGQPILAPQSAYQWSITPSLGEIENGVWVVSSNEGAKGTITLKVGDQSSSIPVTIAKKEVAAPSAQFTDIGPKFIYKKELDYLLSNGIMKGDDKSKLFRPNDSLTRAHAVVILSRVLNLELTNEITKNFKDVPSTHMYAKEIQAAVKAGIVSGNDEGFFNPEQPVSRSQMAKIMVNAFQLEGKSSVQFKDVKASNWDAPYIDKLVGSGVATGYDDGTYQGAKPIQRIHFGKLIYNVKNK